MSYLDEVFGLSGKVAIVTGGGRGIGQTVAIGLAKAGAEVVIIARSNADETIEKITAEGGKCYFVRADVTKEADVDAALAEIMEKSGRIDVVFNNAGICKHQSTFEASIEDWREVVDVNLTGEYIMARAVAKIMVDKGIHGSIINMASMSGTIANIPPVAVLLQTLPRRASSHMTRSLALEWAEYGIRVNSLSPGYIATPMSVDTPQELKDAWTPLMPMHRMGKPEELIPAVLYLASDASGYTTGSDIIVDGAYTCF